MGIPTYDDPMVVQYSFLGQTLASPTARTIKGPKGMKGRVIGVHVTNITVAISGTTTPGSIRVGDGVTANKYIDMDYGTAGATVVAVGGAVTSLDKAASDKKAEVAADSAVVLTPIAPTGGTPAGTADVILQVGWY